MQFNKLALVTAFIFIEPTAGHVACNTTASKKGAADVRSVHLVLSFNDLIFCKEELTFITQLPFIFSLIVPLQTRQSSKPKMERKKPLLLWKT
jgi:hypothetical protein